MYMALSRIRADSLASRTSSRWKLIGWQKLHKPVNPEDQMIDMTAIVEAHPLFDEEDLHGECKRIEYYK